MMDRIPRYAPTEVMTWHGASPVRRAVFHPPGTHRSPIRPDMGALELISDHGSRWYGFEGGAINAELRMTVWGFDSRDEVRAQWRKVPKRLQVPQSRAAGDPTRGLRLSGKERMALAEALTSGRVYAGHVHKNTTLMALERKGLLRHHGSQWEQVYLPTTTANLTFASRRHDPMKLGLRRPRQRAR